MALYKFTYLLTYLLTCRYFITRQVAQFTLDEYEFSVEEEQQSGEVVVGHVIAVDRDSPPYNEVTYTLQFPFKHASAAAFRIVAHNGTIVARRPFDREVRDNFRFVACGCGAAGACASANVTVHVTDVNDHAPAFLLPATPNDSVSVTDYFRCGDVVARLVATDADVGDNGRVGYHLVNVDHVVDFYFRLDDVTGDISARRDDVATGSYTLAVAAVDAGTPPRRVQSALTIFVNISTSGDLRRQRWAPGSGSDNLTVVIVIVGTSLPVAILLVAAILVLLRGRRRGGGGGGDRAAGASRGACGSQSSPDGAVANQEYATLSRGRTTTRLATAAISDNLTRSQSASPNSSLTRLNVNTASLAQVYG